VRGQVEPLHRLKYLMVTRRETATTENLLEGGCLGIKSRSEYRSSRSAKAVRLCPCLCESRSTGRIDVILQDKISEATNKGLDAIGSELA